MRTESKVGSIRNALLGEFRDREFHVMDVVGHCRTSQESTSSLMTKLHRSGVLMINGRDDRGLKLRVSNLPMLQRLVNGKAVVRYDRERQTYVVRDSSGLNTQASRVRDKLVSDFRDKDFTSNEIADACSAERGATSAQLANLRKSGALKAVGSTGPAFIYHVVDTAVIEAVRTMSEIKDRHNAQPPRDWEKLDLPQVDAGMSEPLNGKACTGDLFDRAASIEASKAAADKEWEAKWNVIADKMVTDMIELAIRIERNGASREVCVEMIEMALAVMKQL